MNQYANQGSEFYYRSMKSREKNKKIEIYSTHREGKPVAVERFIRTLKNQICLKMYILIN